MRTLVISFLVLISFAAYAFVLDEKLSDHKLEERAADIFKIVKCPICAGESLYESQSQLACDMRKAIRERIKNGDSDEEIISDLRHIYGDKIINVPLFKINTYALWILPILIFFVGILIISMFHYRKINI
ncbi:MAG: cytochrome c-type biogenesis protein CcmH [Candidatus Mesenet longicola]|uniref:Cytochrome c-type biogenesis protein n=1 Tax=Candidatus Mesenet longicola TaxID=1892558 RepID=A0A8J3HX65_9RICK|nr:MAG: cytochrome c-type biogenesis protein CcmH [Candidatus Mesenet longicola]GHM59221.1 MAG: cytochrome c-type biogenesis protein CcmH [Candidatus Mesenet longicola]